MSKPVKELPPAGTRRLKAPPAWCDGRPHVLEPGVDYPAGHKNLHVVRCNALGKAKHWGFKLETRIHEGRVYVQVVQDERADRRRVRTVREVAESRNAAK